MEREKNLALPFRSRRRSETVIRRYASSSAAEGNLEEGIVSRYQTSLSFLFLLLTFNRLIETLLKKGGGLRRAKTRVANVDVRRKCGRTGGRRTSTVSGRVKEFQKTPIALVTIRPRRIGAPDQGRPQTLIEFRQVGSLFLSNLSPFAFSFFSSSHH